MFAPTTYPQPNRRRQTGFASVALLLLWWLACREVSERAATGLFGRLAGGAFVPLVAAAFLLFLVVLGFLALDTLRGERRAFRNLLGLAPHTTASHEWLIGAAVGWGAVIAAILPLALARSLSVQMGFSLNSALSTLIAIATIAVSTLAVEAVFRGYGFRRLEAAIGPNRAMVVLSVLYAVIATYHLQHGTALLVSFVFALLLSAAWRRTHALWMPWGLHFAWNVSLGVLFGLPLFSGTNFSSVIQSQVNGRSSMAGAGLGPIAAPWTILVLLGAIALLVWVSRDFAWMYTHPPIVAAGYPMDVAPPAAHVAMEGKSAPPPPLVQILPTAPQKNS